MTHLSQLLLLICIIIVSAKLAGALATRFGQPSVFGEILMGLILGPTLLNILGWSIFQQIPLSGESASSFPSLESIIHDLSEIGVILLMFVAGLETDLDKMRQVGKVAFWAAFGGVVGPFLGALVLSHLFQHSWSESAFIGAILTATSVSISAQTLMELKQLKSKEGSTILGAAVIDDVMGIIVLSLVVSFTLSGNSGGMMSIGLICLKIILFFTIAIWFGAKYFEPLAQLANKLPVSQGLMAFVVLIAFIYAWAAEYVGQVAAITGSYLAGVLFTRSKFKKHIDRGIHPLTYSFFVPIFFISIGLRANARVLGNDLAYLSVILAIAVIAKMFGCGIGALLTGFSLKESTRVGVGMISRGEVGLIIAAYGLNHGIISMPLYSIMIIMVLFTTMITPLLLRMVFPKTQEIAAEPVFESIAHLEEKDEEE